MDNVIQNINIEDIIPSNFKPSNEEKRKIDELAVLIKQFGLLDPILVRLKNSKYEIILGMDKYQAALIAGQKMVPVIVKEVDDEIYSKYSNIETKKPASLKTSSKETFSKKENNSDIVNLSELSKIKLEYERDDVKMNNGQLNNNIPNNNLNQPNTNNQNQGPTFGGRFFPSLEDEPTNMNMMGSINTLQTPPVVSNMSNNNGLNNNLIDLTDLSADKESTSIPNLGNQPLNAPTPNPTLNNNLSQPQNRFEVPNLGPTPATPTLSNDTIINLDNLQNNNPAVRPIVEPISPEPVSMDILNADFGAPQPAMNQFDMGPVMNLNNPQPQGFNEPQNPVQPNFGLNQNSMQAKPNPMTPPRPLGFDTNSTIVPDFGNVEPTVASNPTSTKAVTPVTNTIKNLVTSLESFGYKINVTEEDLPNKSKLTIEIEK